jgi:pyruvate/2-oxoglutarate dehydrogenase complex dihydrolipoamide acyltransferase (E2) component
MGARLAGWRKIATAMWSEADDPQIYGALEVDATKILAFVAAARAAGHRITPTHLVGRALAHALHEVPELNVRLVGGEAIPRASVDVFFITMVGGGRDLSGVKVIGADRKNAYEVATELGGRSRTLKSGKDPGFASTKRLMDTLPMPVLRRALKLGAWITGDHDLRVDALKLENSPFGSAIVSSLGSIGLPLGFVPLAWMYKVPIIVVAGEIADKPVAVDGQVVIRPMIPLTATIDHRYADGWHIGQLVKPFRAYLDDPAAFEPVATAVSAPA